MSYSAQLVASLGADAAVNFQQPYKRCYKNQGSSAPKPKGLLPLDLRTGMQVLAGQGQILASVSALHILVPLKQ